MGAETFSFANPSNIEFLEGLYEQYKKNKNSLDLSWQNFFAGYEFAALPPQAQNEPQGSEHSKLAVLIGNYRKKGHLCAKLNPLAPSEISGFLLPQTYGLEKTPPNKTFAIEGFTKEPLTLADTLKKLQKIYCSSIGVELDALDDEKAFYWLRNEIEMTDKGFGLSAETKLAVLQNLSRAEGFEKFLQARYLGQKRFSAEGLDVLIPLLQQLIAAAAQEGCHEVCLGMAHRGRLNVLTNIMKKPYEKMLLEFEGNEFNPFQIEGDVKYHMGYESEVELKDRKMKLYLAANPSHLEAVNPVVEGYCFYRQKELGNVLPVLLHGDAAFMGQGLVAETLNLSNLKGYSTKGTIHIITNNQIGFTTNPFDSRSCTYASGISKVIGAPVLHVNADDPQAVVWVGNLASKFRSIFGMDIVIDLIGYRRYGHNETDEPSFTQPQMYKTIASHPTVFEIYSKELQREGIVTADQVKAIEKGVWDELQAAYEKVKAGKVEKTKTQKTEAIQDFFKPVDTSVSTKTLQELAKVLTSHPESFKPHPKIMRLLTQRAEMMTGNGNVDWAFAELLSFASLAKQGIHVRLTGQDCKRGTFSSRQAVLFDVEKNTEFSLFQNIGPGEVTILNSPLSEQGCLGFEYGYSLAAQTTLVLWEAQFGDFVNGAQIIIDQFIAASEAKWKQNSCLVLLLPHGYEGMGPEHSNARPERFLQLCGNRNIQVCNVTTPAQYFHVLRRQKIRDFKKPLIMMTPKSLLRHPMVQSPLEAFTKGTFSEVLAEVQDAKKIERVIFCTGKIFYELQDKQKALGQTATSTIVRFEQLYPFAKDQVAQILSTLGKAKKFVWVQEEPKNMGAWSFIAPYLHECLKPGQELAYVGRKRAGTTAEGSLKAHQGEQNRLLEAAFHD